MLIPMPAKFGFKSISKFGIVRATNTVRSRYTGHRQTIVYPYAVWVLQGKLIEYPEGPEAQAIRAFLALLDGEANTFQFKVPGYTQNAANTGSGVSATVAAAAGATQMTVGLGFGGGLAGYLKAGEYFTVNDELKLVTADITAGGVLAFKPALRAPVPINTVLTIVNPYCVMASIDEDVATWGLGPPVKHDFDFNAMEAF